MDEAKLIAVFAFVAERHYRSRGRIAKLYELKLVALACSPKLVKFAVRLPDMVKDLSARARVREAIDRRLGQPVPIENSQGMPVYRHARRDEVVRIRKPRRRPTPRCEMTFSAPGDGVDLWRNND